MRRPIIRILLPLLLIVAGGIALAHGSARRELPIWTTVMVEKEEIILERPPAEPWNGPPGPAGRRPNLPPAPPRPKKVKTSKPQDVELLYKEPKIVRDVTVGGIARLADGRLKFTYGPGESGPALCPT